MSNLERDIVKAARQLSIINAVIPCEHCNREVCSTTHLVVYHARAESKDNARGTIPVQRAHRSIFCSDKCLRKYLRHFKLQKEC
jgi:hypothetical protein